MPIKYNKKNAAALRKKLSAGLDLSFKRLVEKKRQTNGEFVFLQKGKIIRVKAKDILE